MTEPSSWAAVSSSPATSSGAVRGSGVHRDAPATVDLGRRRPPGGPDAPPRDRYRRRVPAQPDGDGTDGVGAGRGDGGTVPARHRQPGPGDIERRYGEGVRAAGRSAARLRARPCGRAGRVPRRAAAAHDGPYYKLSLLRRSVGRAATSTRTCASTSPPSRTRMVPGRRRGGRRHPRAPAALGPLPPPPAAAGARGGHGAGRPIRRRRRLDDPGGRRTGRHAAGAGAAGGPRRGADRVLRVHTQLRLPVRRPRLPGHVGPPQRAVQGR